MSYHPQLKMMFDWSTLVVTVGGGVIYSVTTYLKKENQTFEISKLLSTAAIGAGSGIILAFLDIPLADGYQFLIGLGLVPIVENVIKIVWRKFLGKANA